MSQIAMMVVCNRLRGQAARKERRSGRSGEAFRGQLNGYLAGLGLSEGILVVFDGRAGAAPLGDRTELSGERTPGGRAVTLLRA